MKKFWKKALVVLAGGSALAAGPCSIESWKLAFGPVVSNENAFLGVEAEFANGFDLNIPLIKLGPNIGDR